jgi:hypothetical protein
MDIRRSDPSIIAMNTSSISDAQAVTQSFEYYDPFSGPGAPAEPYTPRLDVGLTTLTIGLMSNLFVDASKFLEDLTHPLANCMPGAKFRFYDKGFTRNAAVPAPSKLMEKIREECDAVVCAYGHCSCTSGTVRDAVVFARAGLPVVTLVTHKFIDEAEFLARAGGVPNIPFVFLPHPIAGETAEFQRSVAMAIAPAIMQALANGSTSNAADCLSARAA